MFHDSIILWALVSIATCCHGARILAVFPDPARSHIIAYEPLTKALASRGHQVTVISAFPQKEPLANYTDIAVPFSWFGLDEFVTDMSDLNKGLYDSQSALMSGLVPFKTCKHYLEDPQVKALISSSENFDLVILEVLVYECFLGFAHRFDAPLLGIYAQTGPHWVTDLVGNPSPYSHVPNPALYHSDRMSLRGRIENMFSIESRKWADSFLLRAYGNYMTAKHFGDSRKTPTVDELKRKFSLLMFNGDVSFSFPRPYLPNVIEIAAMHIRPANPLPKDLQTFFDEAEHGVIYFTMGSHIGVFRFPEKALKALLEAFSKLKQRILWKLDEEVEELPPNVKLMSWIPQGDVLAHPKVRVFLTHGGLLGTQEAIYHGVPIVGIPLCKDQFLNIQRAVELGFATRLDFANITEASVLWAVNAVLDNPIYLENARLASSRFRDQIVPPLEKAVFWTEYVLRHKGAGHLRCAALDLAWYEYWLLDVVGVLALGVALLLVVLYAAARALCSLFIKPKVTSH